MARVRQREASPPNGFIASAVRLPTMHRNEAAKAQGWQGEAWRFYDTNAELRFLANWIGNVMSRAVLHAARREGNALVPLTSGPAWEAMEALYGGRHAHPQMLQLLGVDLTVGGEGYITARQKDGEEAWDVLITGKVTQQGTGKKAKVTCDFGDGKKTEMGNDDLVIRVWTPHPADPTIADAPTRSNLKTLGQIVGYDDHISTQLVSRLAGNGVLFISNEVEFAVPEGMDANASQASIFMHVLGEAMMIPIGDRTNPSAHVPIVAMVPTEALGKNEHIKFWSDLDNAVTEMREAAVKRFAVGMDAPAEALLGTADANHWNAWLSEEAGIKAHLEPRLGVVNSAITTQYLRPALTGEVPGDELRDYFVIADTSEIRLRPNRAEEALELNDRGLLNDAATLRETGFKDNDRMIGDEHNRWLLRRISTGATSPEMAMEALRALGVQVGPVHITEPQGQPTHTKPGGVPDIEQRDPPEMPDEQPLAAACEVLVYRALERAGNRLRNQHPRTDAAAQRSDQVYMTLKGDPDYLLAGAWDCANDVLADHGVPVDEVVDVLDFYVRGLLGRQRKFSRHTLSSLLASIRHVEPVG